MWKAWVLLMDANHRQLSAGLQWVWRRLPCYGGCFFLCTCFSWGMATNCVVRATEYWAISNSIIDPIAIERCAFGGGREKADCRLAVLLVFCCCVCRLVGGGSYNSGISSCSIACRPKDRSRQGHFFLSTSCLPVPNLPFLSPALWKWRLGYPNFFSCGDFCKIFLPTIYQFTCYADERPWSWSENTSVVTLLGPQGGEGTSPLAYKGWYAFTPLGHGVFLSRCEEEPCRVAITIRICERWPSLAPQNYY